MSYQEGPLEDTTDSLKLKHSAVELEDPLKNMYEELEPKFEEKMLKLVKTILWTLPPAMLTPS